MKPRTKLEKRVFSLFEKYAEITDDQKEWAKKHCFKHYAYKTKKGKAVCLECAHTFEADPGTTVCPSCKSKITVTETRKRTNYQKKIFAVVTTIEEFQVVKSYHVLRDYRKGKKAEYYFDCTYYLFLRDDGRITPVSKIAASGYYKYANWNSTLEIRKRAITDMPDRIYPKIKVRPIYKRNGFKTSFFDWEPCYVLQKLIQDRRFETLWKLGHRIWLNYYYDSYDKDSAWILLRLCIRNNYFLSHDEISLWTDYVKNLEYFHINIHDVKYLCPKDIHAAHNKYMRMYNEAEEIKRVQRKKQWERERKQQELIRKEAEAIRDKFVLDIKENDLRISLLKTQEEYDLEAIELDHCVNSYFNKVNSLIFSAKENGKHLETIEIFISSMKINQCRGRMNLDSHRHEDILDLMKRQLPLLRKQKNTFKKKINEQTRENLPAQRSA